MAESVVSFLLEKLTSLMEGEVRHLGGIREEIDEVRGELERMRAFLRDADALEDEDEGIKVWVKQVRELAHDTEDIIDEFLLRFEHQEWPGTYGRLAEIARYIRSLKARRRVASALRQIKSRAASISEGRQRYSHHCGSSAERGSSWGDRSYIQSLYERRNDARLVPEAQLFGIERPKRELARWLLEESCHGVQVLAVRGMGGLGKTTLVNQVYRDDQVGQIYQHRAWITVSLSFNLHELLVKIIKQLLEGIGQPVPAETCSKDVYSLKEDIRYFLGDKKYLIVLDDVWTTDSWESLKYAFPDNSYGSRLIATTRNGDVANIVTKELFGGNIYTLNPLTPEESWNLLCARVFQGQPCPLHLEEASRDILERCKGLPLAIVSISGFLASKDTSKEEWERARRSLGAELYSNNQLRDMEKILSLSLNDLPYDLKSCFLYLSMFPEDWHFVKYGIIKLWIAEGFIQQTGDVTPEEVGDLYFNELINRSMFQVVEENTHNKDLHIVKVHDLVWEIIRKKAKNQNFATATSEQNPTVPERVRRLSVDTTLEELEIDGNLSRLRTLIFRPRQGSIASYNSMSEFLSNHGVRLLKVLKCSGLPLDTFPKFITTQFNLRYLDLSCTKVTSIPRSIGRLRNLVTLNLEDTLVEELPAEVLQIHGLRHLMVSRRSVDGFPSKMTSNGVKLPTGIEIWTSLQSLYVIQVSQSGLGLVRSLGKMKQLRCLHIQQLREDDGPILCLSIDQLSHLHLLVMESREDEILDVQHISSPPRTLKLLTMSGRLEKLPSWVPKLESLIQLTLKRTKLKLDPLESIQAMSRLVSLEFDDNAYDGEELCFRAGGFQMLKQLVFDNLERIRRVSVEEGAMPYLQILGFKSCKSLEEVPSGIEFLTSLKKLGLINMGNLRGLRSSREDFDFQRKKHAPALFMGTLS